MWGYFGWGRYNAVTVLLSLSAAPISPDPRPQERPASRLLRSAWVGHGPPRYEEVLGGFMILLLSYLVVMQRLVLLILDRQRDPLEDY